MAWSLGSRGQLDLTWQLSHTRKAARWRELQMTPVGSLSAEFRLMGTIHDPYFAAEEQLRPAGAPSERPPEVPFLVDIYYFGASHYVLDLKWLGKQHRPANRRPTAWRS